MNGNSGTKGILNRKLLACYLINSQNPNCHSLSLFLRSLILQILSHSSLINRDETTVAAVTKDIETKEPSETESKLNEAIDKLKLFDDTIDGDDEIDFKNLKTSTKKIIRQKSAPSPEQYPDDEHDYVKKSENYNTHPPKNCNVADGGCDSTGAVKTSSSSSEAKPSPGKKIKSKIPIPKSRKCSLPSGVGGEEFSSSPTHVGNALKNENEIEEEINNKEKDNEEKDDVVADTSAADETTKKLKEEGEEVEREKVDEKNHPTEKKDDVVVVDDGIKEAPLPKLKSCRTIIADSYYEILMANPDMLEALNVDNIERNPDECFKKIFLFPILEILPPKQTLLILIDSIDENYINEGNLITTLKGNSTINTNTGKSTSCSMSNKSRNVAELLSNHIHLLPKWLFLVCTTKKQTKPITKMFTGFKKITLDDLRKSHVVKDVQEYIINRLNCDFKGEFLVSFTLFSF